MATLYLADRDVGYRNALAQALRESGIQVVEFASGSALYERALASEPDLILLEVELEGMDGFQVFASLQRDRPEKPLPILFVTGFSNPQVARVCRQRGALDYVSKDTTTHEIVERVKSFFRERDPLFGRKLVASLAWLQSRGKSGRLTVESESDNGYVLLHKGKVLEAHWKSLVGDEAVTMLVEELDEAHFRFSEDEWERALPRPGSGRVEPSGWVAPPASKGGLPAVPAHELAPFRAGISPVEFVGILDVRETSLRRATERRETVSPTFSGSEDEVTRASESTAEMSEMEDAAGLSASEGSSETMDLASDAAEPIPSPSTREKSKAWRRPRRSATGHRGAMVGAAAALALLLVAGFGWPGLFSGSKPSLLGDLLPRLGVGSTPEDVREPFPHFMSISEAAQTEPSGTNEAAAVEPSGTDERVAVEALGAPETVAEPSGTEEAVAAEPSASEEISSAELSGTEAAIAGRGDRRDTQRAVAPGRRRPRPARLSQAAARESAQRAWVLADPTRMLSEMPKSLASFRLPEMIPAPESKGEAAGTYDYFESLVADLALAGAESGEEPAAQGERAPTSEEIFLRELPANDDRPVRKADRTLASMRGKARLAAVDSRPTLRAPLRFRYPPALVDHQVSGAVTLWVLVNASGGVEDIQIFRSSGNAELDEAATAAVKEASYIPARRSGAEVAAWTQQRILGLCCRSEAPPR